MSSRLSPPVDVSLAAVEDEEDDGEVVIHPARQDLMRETALKMKESRAEAKAANDAKDAAIRGAEAAQKRVEALMKELKAAQDDAVRARLRGASLFEDNINQKKENQELKKKHEGALADGVHRRATAARAAAHAERARNRGRAVVVRTSLRRAARRRVPCLLIDREHLGRCVLSQNARSAAASSANQQIRSARPKPSAHFQHLRIARFHVSVRIFRCVLCYVTQ